MKFENTALDIQNDLKVLFFEQFRLWENARLSGRDFLWPKVKEIALRFKTSPHLIRKNSIALLDLMVQRGEVPICFPISDTSDFFRDRMINSSRQKEETRKEGL